MIHHRCVYVVCGCGWQKVVRIWPTCDEAQARAILQKKLRAHVTGALGGNSAVGYVRRGWHKANRDAYPVVRRGVTLDCKLCDYRSDPCRSNEEIADCVDEHEHTRTHQEAVEQQRLASVIAGHLR